MDQEFLTAGEVAKILRTHVRAVYRVLNQGKLVGHRPFGQWRIRPEDLRVFLEGKRHEVKKARERIKGVEDGLRAMGCRV